MKQPHRYEGVDTTTTELSKTDEETTKHTTAKGIPTPHELHAHYLSTLALCSAVFSMFYLIFSIFPYGGFMALHLVPGLQPNSVGIYAGILTGSMKIASVVTAYPWGIVSDTYGRKFVLVFSTASSGVFMFAFGFATNFTVAVAIRVLIGLTNATMTIARVSASELAHGNHQLEAKGMGMVMSMVGVGMLFAPSIAGLLSEPITQYATVDFGPYFTPLLRQYPFLLPNVLGAVISFLSTILILVSVEETLPAEQLRSPKYILVDGLSYLLRVPAHMSQQITTLWNTTTRTNDGYEEVRNSSSSSSSMKSTTVSDTTTSIQRTHAGAAEEDISEDLKIVASYLNEEEGLEVSFVSERARASFTQALHRPSVRVSERSTLMEEQRPKDTIASLMADKKVRECLLCYWITTFASTALNETFPLFAMAKVGGLGLDEKSIGLIGTISGVVFVACQYFIFSVSMKHFGLHKTMLVSSLLCVSPAIFLPLSLWISNTTTVLLYTGVMNGITSLFFSNWNAALSITQNRAVHPQSRSRVNGLAAIGTAMARGFGPLVAGVLVTLSYSGGIVPSEYGSFVFYTTIVALGGIAFVINSKLDDDEE